MEHLTVGSLFAGIGGIELGLEWTGGFETKWQVEIDEYARRVLERHWPGVRRYKDVREVGAHNLESVDLICGGFPCQDLSCAGKGAGLKGARSGLWYEMLRIVKELRPTWVLIENVHQGWRRWLPFVRRDLWAVGYASMPIRLQARDVGLWHRRSRIFLVAHIGGIFGSWPANPVIADAGRQRRPQPSLCRQEQEAGRRSRNRTEAPRLCRTIEPCLVRRVHGISHRLERIRCLGNAVVPQCARWVGERILEFDRR